MDPTEQPEYRIRFGTNNEDAVETFRFLHEVSAAILHAPVDVEATIAEILYIIDHGAPIMAYLDGELVGLLGLRQVNWWYNPKHSFLTDRWFFVRPGHKFGGCATTLLAEAQAMANSSGLKVIINGHMRQRGNGIFFTSPRVYLPQKDMH